MNLASLDFALSQISTSIASLTKKNYKQTVADLSQVGYFKDEQSELMFLLCYQSLLCGSHLFVEGVG